MRILSLVPAATEWICAFGGETDLVGRSHACDFPPSVLNVPAVTTLDSLPETSSAIDQEIRRSLEQNQPLHRLDVDAVRDLAPDLIVTQDQCDVCAPPASQLDAALSAWSGSAPQIVTYAPSTLKQILDAALRLGMAIGGGDAAMRRVAEAEARLQQVRTRLGLHRRMDEPSMQRVVCIEWLAPLMTAAHWMPDVISMAGGRALLAEKGSRSEYVSWETICEADPDVLLVAPCGYTIEQTRRERHALTELNGWSELRAVRKSRVYLLDGNAYFNRPGPRIYRAIELVAAALHPDSGAFHWLDVQAWELENLAGRAGVPEPNLVTDPQHASRST